MLQVRQQVIEVVLVGHPVVGPALVPQTCSGTVIMTVTGSGDCRKITVATTVTEQMMVMVLVRMVTVSDYFGGSA